MLIADNINTNFINKSITIIHLFPININIIVLIVSSKISYYTKNALFHLWYDSFDESQLDSNSLAVLVE